MLTRKCYYDGRPALYAFWKEKKLQTILLFCRPQSGRSLAPIPATTGESKVQWREGVRWCLVELTALRSNKNISFVFSATCVVAINCSLLVVFTFCRREECGR